MLVEPVGPITPAILPGAELHAGGIGAVGLPVRTRYGPSGPGFLPVPPAVGPPGPWRGVDPGRGRDACGGKEMSRTPREYALLEVLMHPRGDVTSKSAILAGVWDPAFEGDPNIVEVYIRYLRNKIDVPFDRCAIETVRGMGYRLADDGG